MLDLQTLKPILPQEVFASIEENLDTDKLREVRLRAGRPVAVWYNGEECFLTRSGVSRSSERAIACGADDVRSSVMGASEHSVYAYNDDIGRGFITVGGGVRLGICGEVVTDSGRILTVKNYSSVNIRIPHEILGISRCIMPDIISKAMNILVISPPGGGKTTVLRDLARRFSDEGGFNVLIVDERAEIACCRRGVPGTDIGKRTDVITGGSKRHAFECAVRAVRPDVIVTDELFGDDADIVAEAAGCGIATVASAHASSPENFAGRKICGRLEGIFDIYCFLRGFGEKTTAELLTELSVRR